MSGRLSASKSHVARPALLGLLCAPVAAAYVPAVTAVGPVRTALTRVGLPGRLSGIGRPGHIALTFDDGPDPASTPAFLDLLARHRARATFFLLGEYVTPYRSLVEEMSAAGHEVAVHGWDHTCTVLKRPSALVDEIRRTRELVEFVAARPVRWYRPPYGVLTTPALRAAHAADLDTVLWSAWGRDWQAHATGDRIARTVRRQLRTGGTLLLHDTDRTCAPRSWWRTLAATETLLQEWTAAGVAVGPLADHWPDPSGTEPAGCRT